MTRLTSTPYDPETWRFFLVEVPKTYRKGAHWVEYSLPMNDENRTRAQKAAYRRLERIALIGGVTIQMKTYRKTD